jgi:hypothetical protein
MRDRASDCGSVSLAAANFPLYQNKTIDNAKNFADDVSLLLTPM